MTETPDLVAALRASVEAARLRRQQRELDNKPCPDCGGDRLRPDFTGSGRCHAETGYAQSHECCPGADVRTNR